MTQPAKSQEPSMEEILASIRRIIADDDANKSATRAPEPPKAESRAPPAYCRAAAIRASTSRSAPGHGAIRARSAARPWRIKPPTFST